MIMAGAERRVAFREFRTLPRADRGATVRAARDGQTWGDARTQGIARRWAEAIASRKQWAWLVFAVVAVLLALISLITHSWWLLAPAIVEALTAMGSRVTQANAQRILAVQPEAIVGESNTNG